MTIFGTAEDIGERRGADRAAGFFQYLAVERGQWALSRLDAACWTCPGLVESV